MSNLKLMRVMKGISQARLSVLSDVDPATISRIETDSVRNTPGIQGAKRRIAAAMQTSIQCLFPEADNK